MSSNEGAVLHKRDLAAQMVEEGHFPSKKAAEAAVESLFGHISNAVHHEQKVRISGFGTFSLRHRAARKARKPGTDEVIEVPAKDVMVFKASK
mgnify:CR=1 FL=1